MSYNKIIIVRKSTPLYLTVQFLLLLFIAGKDLESENVDRKDMMLPGKQLQLLQDVVSMSESCFHSNVYHYMYLYYLVHVVHVQEVLPAFFVTEA